jgi:proline iminopeptidase
MAERYPAVEPYESGLLPVTDGHRLYWEMCGARDGTAAVYLHGGPGSGCTPKARRNFDPRSYRAVLFDQRGCGRSRPLASDGDADLSTNTTAHLIGDLERLRDHLGIDRWVVVGGSWGVTLALVYAQRHPERVIAVVLAAVTAGTRRETDWITRDMGRVFPREREQFTGTVPVAEREGALSAAYARLLADSDPQLCAQAARQWCAWEGHAHVAGAGVGPAPQPPGPGVPADLRPVGHALLEPGCFVEEGEILANMHRLADIPAILIHGRYDVSGPLDTARRLHRAWPKSKLVVLDDAGHGGGSFTSEIVGALDSFRTLL